ncbi:MAG TPA: phosphatase PAP2 family protein [Gaiellales bacterium]|nr:phosphatase PAP2 family protein [Gaiellales bacterium]
MFPRIRLRANTWDEEVVALPVAALLIISIVAGLLAWAIAGPVLRRPVGRQPSSAVADEVREHTAIRRFVHSRLDSEVLTGLALTLAVCMLCLAGVVISLLVLMIRHSEPLADLDAGAARWAHHHSGAATHSFLDAVTSLASTRGVIVIAVIVGVVEWIRVPNRWIPVFLLAVTLGDSFVTNTIKGIVDRSRPTIDPIAASLGPSFPSGHSSTAAALFAALALLAGRRRSPRVRAILVGVAVGLAVAVACSRVLLDLHWVSDVIAGLTLGWAWFALCAIAFGGWALRLGAVVEQASRPRSAKPPQREVDSARS